MVLILIKFSNAYLHTPSKHVNLGQFTGPNALATARDSLLGLGHLRPPAPPILSCVFYQPRFPRSRRGHRPGRPPCGWAPTNGAVPSHSPARRALWVSSGDRRPDGGTGDSSHPFFPSGLASSALPGHPGRPGAQLRTVGSRPFVSPRGSGSRTAGGRPHCSVARCAGRPASARETARRVTCLFACSWSSARSGRPRHAPVLARRGKNSSLRRM